MHTTLLAVCKCEWLRAQRSASFVYSSVPRSWKLCHNQEEEEEENYVLI